MINNLKPEKVFKYFQEICAIPHGSGNLENISNYCVEFAKKHGFYYRQDESLNVVIKAPGSMGYENVEPVIIQGHMDMVCVKDEDCQINLEKEGLNLCIVEDNGEKFLAAKKTTLGGDDGIAIAIAMAIMDSHDIVHPPIEAIFTVNEEIGMLGALDINLYDINGKTMLNLDSEEEGILLLSCAGGATVECIITTDTIKKSGDKATIKISGISGGHSGTDIIKGGASANYLIGRLLAYLLSDEDIKKDFNLISVNGGEKDNAISISSELVCMVENKDKLKEKVEIFADTIKKEYMTTDKNMVVDISFSEAQTIDVLSNESQKNVSMALLSMPHGVQKMSCDIENLVQTSLNMGILRTKEDGVHMTYSVRSSVKSEKKALMDKLAFMTSFLGGEVNISGDYPAWEYVKDSKLRNICMSEYKSLFGHDAKAEAIHAGVECGIMAEKIPGLDCVSLGPDIKDIHTTSEKLSISSVERTWELLLAVLENLCKNLD